MVSEKVNYILAQVASFDKCAKSRYEIDSKIEWEKLGSFLNGSCPITNNTNEENTNIDALNNEEKGYLTSLWESLKSSFENDTLPDIEKGIKGLSAENYKKKEYNKLIKQITIDNIADVSTETIYAILDNEQRAPKDVEADKQYLWDLLSKKAEKLEIDSNEFFDKDNLRKSIIYLKLEIEKEEEYIATQTELNKVKNKINTNNYSQSELQKYADMAFVELQGNTFAQIEIPKVEFYTLDYGDGWRQANGEVSQGSAVQRTGNCWLMGGINSLTTSLDSTPNKDLDSLNNDIYRDKMYGITVVRIPEAAKYGYGKDGKGIYVITDYELSHTVNLSEGDYDIAAYNLAVERYFQETKEQIKSNVSIGEYNGTLDGNNCARFYELRTGQKAQRFEKDEIPQGVGLTCFPDFSSLYDFHKSGGKVNLGLRLDYVNRYGNTVYGGHAFSVVDTKDGKLIVQESNNSEEIAALFPGSWKDEKGIWNIPLDEDIFKEKIIQVGTLKT